MRYLSEDQVTQMMGIGYVGEVRQGPDGNLYQYVQGVDGLGKPIGGFWSRIKKGLKKAVKVASPFASLVPGGAAALTVATPFLKRAGIAGREGLGALYQASDGSLYQLQGLGDAEMYGLEEDETAPWVGPGTLGEVRQGQDGRLYQWVEGIDGLGNPVGFWRKVKSFARKAALTAATPILNEAGVAGSNGLAALYQAPEGGVYPTRGIADDEDLRGLDDDEELRGFAEDEELRGLDDDEELLRPDEELRGFADDEELRGLEEDPELQGVDGYVREDGMNGLDAYVPQEPPQTRWHARPTQVPDVWKPLW